MGLEVVFLAAFLLSLAFLIENAPARLLLGVAGCAFLLYLAGTALMEARKGKLPECGADQGKGDFVTGAIISLGTPFQIAFWIGIWGSSIAALVPQPQPIHYAVFFSDYMIASLLFCFMFAGAVGFGKWYINVRTFQVIEVVCALFLEYMGLTLLWSTITSL